MSKRYLRKEWNAPTPAGIKHGDYVVATKYRDGDPSDHFCVGFYDRRFDHYGTDRHLVTDECGKQFRHNGFRRVSRISRRRGGWIVNNFAFIVRMEDRFSVWHWVHAPWSELNAAHANDTGTR